MNDSATVAAADIARLAGVGRAAVSNWRRRFEDFPAPVGGTSSSPLFSLAEVEDWLRRQGKLAEVPLDERIWQQLRAGVEDLHLSAVVGHVGAFLLLLDRNPAAWKKLARSAEVSSADFTPEGMPEGETMTFPTTLLAGIAELAAERGAAAIFDFLCDRYLDAHTRRVAAMSAEAAELLAALAGPESETVFDPTCGLGALLLAAAPGAAMLYGQDRDENAARIAAARLLLHGHEAVIRVGDSLRADAFGSLQADAVLCNPPFGERSWGYEELAGDMRWQYGLPPRGEPELPWVQHGLFHLKPGGHMVVLMPSAAADRRSGRRIRAQLLRTGTLRAVVALPTGTAPQALGTPHLWILRKPMPDDPIPTHVLMAEAAERIKETVLALWRGFSPESEGAVPLIDLLDEEVDLTPARHLASGRADAEGFSAGLDALAAAVSAARAALEALRIVAAPTGELPMATIAEQIRAGAVTLYQAPRHQAAEGRLPMLTVEDVLAGRGPSGRTSMGMEMVLLEPDDVVVPAGGRAFVAQVVKEGGAVLGSGLHVFRADPSRLDPRCLAGFLRVAGLQAGTGTSRSDIRRVEIPRLPMAEQRRLGATFQQLEALETAVGQVAVLGSALVREGFAGIGNGSLTPEA
ncbi:N-6 DNA methylase [Nonomuraea sp. NPDC059194]|uniref:N-6 DNA methylase n=1 Tax=Nonomuraea sp. NPDC059194 TaxID=3346764 RepID=UPI0036A5BB15